MTNAEKYLKEGVSVREFRNKLTEFFWDELGLYEGNEEQIYTIIGDFLDNIEQPTLTEDERVILRNTSANTCNAKNHYITRTKGSGRVRIKLKENGEEGYFNFAGFDHLFQFIKERRRI